MELKLSLSVSEARVIYNALKNSKPKGIIEAQITKYIIAKIKKYAEEDC